MSRLTSAQRAGVPAPSARLTSAKAAATRRASGMEGAGVEITRQRTRTRNPAASPDVAAHDLLHSAPAGRQSPFLFVSFQPRALPGYLRLAKKPMTSPSHVCYQEGLCGRAPPSIFP